LAFEGHANERRWRRGLETRCRARGVIRADHSALFPRTPDMSNRPFRGGAAYSLAFRAPRVIMPRIVGLDKQRRG